MALEIIFLVDIYLLDNACHNIFMDIKRILYIDDNEGKINDFVENIQIEGYKIKTFSNPLEALNEARFIDYDVLVLDIMMPFLDGFQLFQRLSQMDNFKGQPTFFFSETIDEELMLEALKYGSGELLTPDMPWSVKRMRILNKISPTKTNINDSRNSFGINIDHTRFTISKLGIEVQLTHKEVLLISKILSQKDVIIEEIIDDIWGANSNMSANNLATHISNLNKKIKCFGIKAKSKKGSLALHNIE